MDYSRYPSEVFQKKWIRMYLEEVALLDGMIRVVTLNAYS